MKRNIISILSFLIIMVMSLCAVSCSDKEEASPNELKARCLKRTLGPNIVGNQIYFAYAMAMPYGTGKIESCTVEASVPGAEGTYLENNSYHTNSSGMDIPVQIGTPSVNNGNKTTVTFTVDTCAATLRYYYVIPEEARGKEVSFTFTVKSNDGQVRTVNMGPYTVSKQYMKRDITLSKTRCYISIEDMATYTLAEAQEKPEKIDLVYLWRNKTREGVDFGHTFAAPAADKEWLDDVEVPETFKRDIKLRKEWGIIDGHLTDEPDYGTYIDDIDFETIQLEGMPDYCVNMKQQGGMWIETADGKYRAYIYINSLKSISGGVISIKRYNME